MAYLEEVMDTKNTIIQKLISSQPIVDTINNTSINSNDDLIGQNIFRDLYIPDEQQVAKTYICLGVFVTKVTNHLIKTLDVHFWIFSHQDVMDTGLGYTRVDKIQSEIDKLINGTYSLGIDKAELKGSYQYKVLKNYTGVELIYQVPNLNQDTRFAATRYDR